jgi:hypothetical protein
MDVPEFPAGRLPVPTPAEKMLTPGAVIHGLSMLSPFLGPPELKLANPLKLGLGTDALLTVVIDPSAARSRAPSDVGVEARPRTPMNGIVTVNGIPVSGLEKIGPSYGGSPVELFTIATAA